MQFRTRKMIAARDLNSNGTLFGGRVLDWIDEEAFIFASCQLDSDSVVTRSMSEINFIATGRLGDVIEIGMETAAFGRTSITLRCEVRNRRTRETVTAVDRIVFVQVDAAGRPAPHGREAKAPEPPALPESPWSGEPPDGRDGAALWPHRR